MGGIKNRDEKLKKNKVFTSGGGGGSKGPSVIDKRGQELQCPHCQRVFKQSGRLQDHIKRQHADLGASETPSEDGKSVVKNETKKEQLNAKKEGRNLESDTPKVGSDDSKKALSTSGRRECKEGSQDKMKQYRIMDIGSKAGAYDYKSPKLLLHELLIRNKQPKARYKSLPDSNSSDLWRCKVVLPHPKNSEKDTVIFLDSAHVARSENEAQQRAAVAALHRIAGDRSIDKLLPPPYLPFWKALAEAEKARQAKKAELAEKQAQQKASQQARLKKQGHSTVIMTEDKRRYIEGLISEMKDANLNAANEPSNTPEDGGWHSYGWPETEVVNTDHNLSKDEKSTITPSGSAVQSTVLQEQKMMNTSVSNIMGELIALGFEEKDIRRALSALNVGESRKDNAHLLTSLLDWLCFQIPEENLPSMFAPGAAGKPIDILHTSQGKKDRKPEHSKEIQINQSFSKMNQDTHSQNQVDISNASDHNLQIPVQEQENLDLLDPAVKDLMCYGYPRSLCEEALKANQGHIFAALKDLFNKIFVSETGIQINANSQEESLASSSLDDWNTEREALSAIYDTEVVFNSDSWTTISLQILLDNESADIISAFSKLPREHFLVDGVRMELDIWVSLPNSHPAEECNSPHSPFFYPNALPIFAVKSTEIPPQILLLLTKYLLQGADSLRGTPMIYSLISLIHDELPRAAKDGLTSNLGRLLRSSNKATSARPKQDEAYMSSAEENGVKVSSKVEIQKGRPHKQRALKEFEIKTENKRLIEWQKELQKNPKYDVIREKRSKLPASTKRDSILEGILNNRVLVIDGATGCGKSTQVPQYILEKEVRVGRGGYCNIICTQPRRISALALASRVAYERGETVGSTVGYSVRLDSKQSAQTRLLFCTTGILLRRLQSNSSLDGITHVVVDEVHERSLESDLLLMLLREIIRLNLNPKLTIVLMSATADANLFASYFTSDVKLSDVSILTIPGFTYPVKDLYLEDVIETTGFQVGKSSRWALKKSKSSSIVNVLEANKESELLDDAAQTKEGCNVEHPIEVEYSNLTLNTMNNIDESLVNHDLIESLVVHIASTMPGIQNTDKLAAENPANAILVFAPGMEEINRIVRTLQNSSRLNSIVPGGIKALPLHGSLSPSQQNKVFDTPPPGVLKIVVATNVAETSITIDDIVVVIDTGRVKEMSYDVSRGLTRLKEMWVSQAAAQQRRGRAGRVRPGHCWRLYSRRTWTEVMEKNTAPEVLRVPLQGLVMDVKGILGDKAVDVDKVLQNMISPPNRKATEQAINMLTTIGAIDVYTGHLTPLGHHLVRMPCDSRLGKMLIYGALLRCMDPILTITAALSHGRQIFFSPVDRRQEAEDARKSLLGSSASSKSDHLAIVSAYNGWRASFKKGGRVEASKFCGKYFLSEQSMDAIHIGRKQYADILADLGFLPEAYADAVCTFDYSPVQQSSSSIGIKSDGIWAQTGSPDEYSNHARLVKSALAAGLYPQLLRVEHPAAIFAKVSGGAIETEGEARRVKFFDKDRGRVFLHPSSLNFSVGKFESGWLVYSDIVQTSKIFVRETTMVPVYAILLFGGELSVHHQAGLIRIDSWATFKAPARIAVLVRELRAAAANLLEAKVGDPSMDLGRSKIIDAMLHLCSTDGF